MRRYSPYRLSAIFLVAVSIALLGAGAPQLGDQSFDLSALVWISFVYAILGPLVITNLLWFSAIDRVGPSRASLFANLQPFLAAVVALLLLHEKLTRLQFAGGLLIAAGIVFSRGRRPPPEPT
jgi:drug/metabolite transporter (DMT)-like permease